MNLKNFFILDEVDEAIGNNILEGYINKIKDDHLFDGHIKIFKTTKIFNLSIAIYERNNANEDYTQYDIFISATSSEEYIIINFEETLLYNILKEKNTKTDNKIFEKNISKINNNKFKFNET